MSMTEVTAETPKTAEKKKPKKRHARPNKRPVEPATVQAPPPSILEGLTITDCAAACYSSGKCAISGSVCAHPGKGGLQVALQNPDSMKLFSEAKRIIGQNRLDLANR